MAIPDVEILTSRKLLSITIDIIIIVIIVIIIIIIISYSETRIDVFFYLS